MGFGEQYRGYASNTGEPGNLECVDWTGSKYGPWYKKNVGTRLPQNLCRNPDPKKYEGVWCYTSNDFEEWHYCDVRRCSVYDAGKYHYNAS